MRDLAVPTWSTANDGSRSVFLLAVPVHDRPIGGRGSPGRIAPPAAHGQAQAARGHDDGPDRQGPYERPEARALGLQEDLVAIGVGEVAQHLAVGLAGVDAGADLGADGPGRVGVAV